MFGEFASYAPQSPDLMRVRSIPDQEEFGVHKSVLRTSEVFSSRLGPRLLQARQLTICIITGDMFACCDQEYSFVNIDDIRDINQVLELDESGTTLRLLLRLLHFPPPPPSLSPSARETRRMGTPASLYEGDLIPFPLLPDMFRLIDKYGLSEPLRRAIHSHLFANAAIHPLMVYGYAARNHMVDVAAEASAYLLHPPLATYSEDQIALLPSVSAYHDLVRLHSHRIQQLKSTLLGEDIFPFGYGVCVAHQEDTTRAWNDFRMLLATQLEAATDLAAEMTVLLKQFDSCKTCHKACSAAIEMLRYKCNRIPRTIDYLPPRGGN